jgi:NADPH:quinone reductase-like Zn-dependent oxidoreductase
MKAAVLSKTGNVSELGNNLTLEDLPVPSPAENEVLINIKYASLNRRDLYITKGLYAKISLPVVLGSDCSGVVAQTGENVTAFTEGDEVIVNPSMNWGEKEEHQVYDYRILGMPDDGTLEEYICVKADHVFAKPSNLSPGQASALPLAGLTAYRACFVKAEIKEGDTVLIPGIGGGVSTFALLYALSAGADVYVTSGSDEKVMQAIALGAKGGINYKKENWEKMLHGMMHNKLDVVIDGSGGETITKCLSICSYGARIVSYGATLGITKDFDMRKVYWKQVKVMGSTMGSDNDFGAMLQYIEEKNIVPVIDKVFELDNVHEAFYRMDKSEQMGKIVVKVG